MLLLSGYGRRLCLAKWNKWQGFFLFKLWLMLGKLEDKYLWIKSEGWPNWLFQRLEERSWTKLQVGELKELHELEEHKGCHVY